MDNATEDEKKPCTYEDLSVFGTSNQTYTVNEDFVLGELVEDTGLENIESVDCNNCGNFFNDLKYAKEHVEEQGNK